MHQHARARARRTLAAATTLAVAAGLATALTTTPALATDAPAAPEEVVIPNPGREQPRYDGLKHAGTTGYAHSLEGSGTVWTDYATGNRTPIDAGQVAGHSGHAATLGAGTLDQPRTVTIEALGSGAKKTVTLPPGQMWSKTYNADTALAYTKDADGRLASLTLYQAAEDGSTTSRAVTGLPEHHDWLLPVSQDLRGAVLRVLPGTTGGHDYYLLDYASATLQRITATSVLSAKFALGDRQIVISRGAAMPLLSVPRDNPAATPVETVLPPALSDEGPGLSVAVVGDTVVYQRSRRDGGPYNGWARTIPLGGTTVTELLPHAEYGSLTTAPDGSVLVVGGTGALDWAVHRLSPADGVAGRPAVSRLHEVPRVPRTVEHLALGGGRLSFLSPTGSFDISELVDIDTDIDGTPAWTAPKSRDRFGDNENPSGLVALGDGDSATTSRDTVVAPTTGPYTRDVYGLPYGSTVVDGAGRHVIAKHGDTTYVGDLDGTGEAPLTFTKTATAVWDGKLWKNAGTTGDQVNSYDLKTKATSPALDLGADCRPTELQAVGRWLYWACGAAKAGVYDLTLKKSVGVPAGEALLGDGFVVRHEGDKLRLTEAATGATRDFADLPASAAGSGRGTTWTVDRFGGDVAYLDAAQDFRLRRAGVARQPWTRLDSTVRGVSMHSVSATSGIEPVGGWGPAWRFSRPVGAWKVDVRKGDGELVRTFTGTRGTGSAVRVDWDGRDTRGRGIESGQYRWELRAAPLDGVGSTHTSWGSLDITGSSLTTVPGTYTPVPPTRIMNTIAGLGVPKAKIGPRGTAVLKVAGRAGVPTSGVTAVVLNVTATNPTTASYVSVYPHATRRTATSNLNVTAGQSVANLVTVPVVDGWVEFYNHSGSVDLLADIAGYYTEGTSGATYQPVTPKRILSTVGGIGAPKAKVGPKGTVTLTIDEPGVSAVAMNVTATNPTATSYVSVYPYGTARPPVSNLNFTAGKSVPNLVIVPVEDGKVTLYNHAGTVDLLADVTGYFKHGAGSVFTGMQPMRVMNTIAGVGVSPGKVGAGRTVDLWVGTKYSAVVLNVTATNPTATSYVSVYPYGTARPPVSNLNFTAGQSVPNLVIVPVRDGKVTFYNHAGSVDLLADVAGYYTG
ncbi:hypothetical protein [Streptomyces sp. NPDC126499]|uniref:hypothetical protein n=1 Tax=Streptomyces sp. NPDC126499 TaxID=3155314 RepID=UPI003322729A